MAKTRYRLLTVFSALGGAMLVASVGWACTMLVGNTVIEGEPAGSSGAPVSATGTVTNALETDDCPSSGCNYQIVMPAPGDTGHVEHSPSCHYDDPEASANATEDNQGEVTILEGTVNAPQGPGQTVVCFNSKEKNSNKAPATGTAPEAFLILD